MPRRKFAARSGPSPPRCPASRSASTCRNSPGCCPAVRSCARFTTTRARACDLLTSPAAHRAFRLDQESVRLRDAYGRNIYGQSLLLARRLVEAGTRLVCVAWAPHATASWDTHGTIASQPPSFDVLKQRLLPPFDAGISSLVS